jgi:hypothetical protein
VEPAAHVITEDAVFFDQVRHGRLLPVVEPADQHGQRSDIASSTAGESISPSRSQGLEKPSAEQ